LNEGGIGKMEATIIDCQWRNMLCRGRGEKNASSKVATSAYTLKSTKEVFNDTRNTDYWAPETLWDY
jgi:hypothetical protein